MNTKKDALIKRKIEIEKIFLSYVKILMFLSETQQNYFDKLQSEYEEILKELEKV